MKNQIYKFRVNWIDWAKSIGIFLVVLGHIKLQNSEIKNFIFSFHIPLFFFLSGYLEKIDLNILFKEFLIKSFKRLLIPYFLFKILAIPLYIYWFRNYNFSLDLVQKPLIGFFIGDATKTNFSYPLNPPTWFLLALFEMKILFFILNKFFKNLNQLFFISILFCFLAIIIHYNSKDLIFCIDSVLMTFIFYILGYLFKKYENRINIKISYLYVIFIISFILVYFINHFNDSVDVNYFKYGNFPLLFYLGSILGIIMILSLCFLLNYHQNKFIIFISKNTLLILGLHTILNSIIFIFLKNYFLIDSLIISYALLLALIELIILIPLIIFINKV